MIHYRNTVRGSGIDGHAIKRTAKKLLAAVDQRESALSISFVDDQEIRELNRAHRGKDKPTDVLSFPLWEEGDAHLGEHLLGDVVISVDTARRQAADYDASLEAEINRLLIHGVLHVMGHDHEETAEREEMRAEERRLAQAIGLIWPYED